LQEIIARLLKRDRALRYQTAGDAASALRRLRRDISNSRNLVVAAAPAVARPSVPISHKHNSHKHLRYGLAIGGVAAICVVAIVLLPRRPLSSLPPLRMIPFSGAPGMEDDLSFSPEGKQAAFSWNGGAGRDYHIYVKLVGAGPPLALTSGVGFDSSPAWSPDSRYIAFTHDHGITDLMIVSSLGGPERRISSIDPVGPDQGSRALTWTPDGTSLLISDRSSSIKERPAIFSVSVASGEKRRLTSPSPEVYGDGDPQFSSNGNTLAFLRWNRNSVSDIYLRPWPDGEIRRLTADQNRISGYAWAADGQSIVVSSKRGGLSTLWRVPLSGGAPEPLAGAGQDASAPAISRKGNFLAFTYQLENGNIWRMPLGRQIVPPEQFRKLIASPRQEISGVYSPDGTRIVFSSDRSGSFELWLCDSDGSHPVQLTSYGTLTCSPHWSPDGKWILFDSRREGHGVVYVISAGGGEARQLTSGKGDDILPNWSHDGSRIYFASNRSGGMECWQMPAGGEDAKGGSPIQITHAGGFQAEESADGRWLYYSKQSGGIWRKPLVGGSEARVLARTTAR
jgi:Tol biopolymer transport system component